MTAPAISSPTGTETEDIDGPPSLRALTRYFLHLGTVGFGGPVVLVERMRRDLQEARRWFTRAEYI